MFLKERIMSFIPWHHLQCNIDLEHSLVVKLWTGGFCVMVFSSSAGISTCLLIISTEKTHMLIFVALSNSKLDLMSIICYGLLSLYFIQNKVWPSLSLAKIAIVKWRAQLACSYLKSTPAYMVCQVLQMDIMDCLCCYCWTVCCQCTHSAISSIMQNQNQLKYWGLDRVLGIFS